MLQRQQQSPACCHLAEQPCRIASWYKLCKRKPVGVCSGSRIDLLARRRRGAKQKPCLRRGTTADCCRALHSLIASICTNCRTCRHRRLEMEAQAKELEKEVSDLQGSCAAFLIAHVFHGAQDLGSWIRQPWSKSTMSLCRRTCMPTSCFCTGREHL